MTKPTQKEMTQWLDHFFNRTDYSRVSGGQSLYDDGALTQMKRSGRAVEAVVRDQLRRTCRVSLSLGPGSAPLPPPAQVTLTCDCSDQAEYCIHKICVLIYWLFNFEKNEPESLDQETEFSSMEKALNKHATATKASADYLTANPATPESLIETGKQLQALNAFMRKKL